MKQFIEIGIYFVLICFVFFVINKRMSQEYFKNKDPSYTFVSGYWNVKNKHAKDNSKYLSWFQNTLRLNEPYVFFLDKKDKDVIEPFRKKLPTKYVDYTLDDFYTNNFYKNHWIHNVHVPSKELGKIWLEKIHLVKLAKDKYDKNKDFYIWIDAGIAPYRENPFPSKKISKECLLKLPKDKVSYSYVKDYYHNFGATAMIFPKNVIDKVHDLFYEKLRNCEKEVGNWKCGSDQFTYTKLVNEHPELFYKITEGYGENIKKLFKCS